MLKLKSFDVKEGDKMSEFLQDHTIAIGATILITNGWIVIPYEDGKDFTIAQKIILSTELRNAAQEYIRKNLNHDVRKFEVMIFGIKNKIKEAKDKIDQKTGNKKKDYDIEHECLREIKTYENMVTQHEASIMMTKAGITDKMTEIAVYDEEIANLEAMLKDQAK